MMGSSTQAAQTTIYQGVRVQSSTFGLAQPLVYGSTRVTVNLIWYGDFLAIGKDAGGK